MFPDQNSFVAYELNSRYWRQGVASDAAQAVLKVLQKGYGVHTCIAAWNGPELSLRRAASQAWLIPTKTEEVVRYRAEPDELVMIKSVRDSKPSHEHPQWGLFALPNE